MPSPKQLQSGTPIDETDMEPNDLLGLKKLQRTVNSTKLLMTYSTASSYLEVLTAQQTLLQAELTEVKEIQACLQGMTALYRAMGDIFIRL